MTIDTTPQPEQLTLHDTSTVPPQFRLSRQARLRGLAHVAELRRLLRQDEPDHHTDGRAA
jgi:hypothetical protein